VTKLQKLLRQYEKLRLFKKNGKPQLYAQYLKRKIPLKLRIIEESYWTTCYTFMTTLILKRINLYIEEIVGNYRFRRGKSTTDHVFALRQIMSKYYEFGKDLHLVFLDYKQAYDSVDREDIWKALVILGIPKKYATENIMQSTLFARHFRFF
jgi:hypothetical protein